VQTIQHLLPPAAVGLGAGIMNIFAGRSQNYRREEFEKVMLVAKYKADERGSLGIAPKIVYWYTIMTLLVRQNHCTARVLVI
jgi:hypothetical protein